MTQNKSSKVELVKSAAEVTHAATAATFSPNAPVPALSLADDATVYLHIVPSGIWTMRTARGKAAATKPIVLEPSGAETMRYTVTAKVARAYIAATNPVKRAAILLATGVQPLVSPAPDAADGATPSNLTPEAARVFGWLDLASDVEPLPEVPATDYVTLARRLLSQGVAAIPAKVKAAKVKAAKVKTDTTDATFAAIFAARRA